MDCTGFRLHSYITENRFHIATIPCTDYTVLQIAMYCYCLIMIRQILACVAFDMYYVINMYHAIVLSNFICTISTCYCGLLLDPHDLRLLL